ncbi:MAG: hypothetical protein R3Y11_12125 [Pseudomonadota bacterium]
MTTIRHFKLNNNAGFVAKMEILWTGDDGTGNLGHGTYKPSGYHDICIHGERSIDLAETPIPNGATVQLKVDVVLGKDKVATKVVDKKTVDDTYTYDKSVGDVAEYVIKGTTLHSTLTKV